jgi:tetratricopeptide (TPR) repeat protein
MAYTKIGMQDKAISDFSQVLLSNPDHVNALFARAACYNTVGQFSAAIEDYNIALLKDHSRVSASGDRSPDKRRPGTPGNSSASGYGGSSSQFSPDAVGSSNGSGSGSGAERRYTGMGGSYPHTAQQISPHSHHGERPRLDSTGSTGDSMENDDSGHSIGGQSGSGHGLATRQQHQQQPATSASPPPHTSNSKHLQDPQRSEAAEAYHRSGFEHRRQGNFTQAVQDYTRAIELDPRHFKATFNRAFAYDKVYD